ncbi:hypothetical protein KIN20_029908 [Parelaphostrongylus tenuis]|uniref:Uncharacterized protein n=1 Tax=Parelaphostrongylus tenuis TaxID=148309 RepID=A0AAD5R3B1_PARTN|nr:hypothetical protein KIN20_029908 [Parelaphostrongylus tenuis]
MATPRADQSRVEIVKKMEQMKWLEYGVRMKVLGHFFKHEIIPYVSWENFRAGFERQVQPSSVVSSQAKSTTNSRRRVLAFGQPEACFDQQGNVRP